MYAPLTSSVTYREMIDTYGILSNVCLSKICYCKPYEKLSSFELGRCLGLSQAPLLNKLFTSSQLESHVQRGFIFEKEQIEKLFNLLNDLDKFFLCLKVPVDLSFQYVYQSQKDIGLLAEFENIVLKLVLKDAPEFKSRIKKEIFS